MSIGFIHDIPDDIEAPKQLVLDYKVALAVEHRFWPKVSVVESGCWEWNSALTSTGYGQMHVTAQGIARPLKAHRISWVLANKSAIPGHLEIDHLCSNRKCVHPLHLEAVPHLLNVQRAKKHACIRGHVYTEATTYITREGARLCRTCARLSRGERGIAPANRTHCKSGHPFDEANTYRYKKRRACKECRRKALRESRQRRREVAT